MYKVIIRSMHTLLVANNVENCNEHFFKMNIWTFVDHFFYLCFKNWLFFLFQKFVLSTFLWSFFSILSLLFVFDSLFFLFSSFLTRFLGFSPSFFFSRNICKTYNLYYALYIHCLWLIMSNIVVDAFLRWVFEEIWEQPFFEYRKA